MDCFPPAHAKTPPVAMSRSRTHWCWASYYEPLKSVTSREIWMSHHGLLSPQSRHGPGALALVQHGRRHAFTPKQCSQSGGGRSALALTCSAASRSTHATNAAIIRAQATSGLMAASSPSCSKAASGLVCSASQKGIPCSIATVSARKPFALQPFAVACQRRVICDGRGSDA